MSRTRLVPAGTVPCRFVSYNCDAWEDRDLSDSCRHSKVPTVGVRGRVPARTGPSGLQPIAPEGFKTTPRSTRLAVFQGI